MLDTIKISTGPWEFTASSHRLAGCPNGGLRAFSNTIVSDTRIVKRENQSNPRNKGKFFEVARQQSLPGAA
jgi:hypothetical protein